MITSKTVVVHGYRLHVLEGGNGGVSVLLLQGFPVSAEYWRATLRVLEHAGYRGIAVDILGFGRSEKPADAPYSLQFFASLFDALLGTLGIDQAAFVGHSFGGKLALATALLYPHRVQRLMLVDSDGFTPIPLFIRIPGPLWLLGEFLLWLASNPVLIRAQLQLGFYDPASHVTPEMIELGRAVLRVGENRRVLMLMSRNYRANDLHHTGLRARLGELRCPTLVVWGEHDRIFPPRIGRIACEEIPGARLVSIPRCGHFPHIERPREFHGLLMGFLSGLASRSERAIAVEDNEREEGDIADLPLLPRIAVSSC